MQPQADEMSVRGAEHIDPATPLIEHRLSPAQRNPEHALWLGVFELAMRDVMTSEHIKLVKRAVKWIAQDTRDFGDFLWITDNLEMPSETVQTRLLEIGRERLAALMQLKESKRAKSRSS